MSELEQLIAAANDVSTHGWNADDSLRLLRDRGVTAQGRELLVMAGAELQRHKRAIEWCLNNAARRARDDNGERCIMNADYDDVLSPPSDIADLVKGEK